MKVIGLDGKSYGWQMTHQTNSERKNSEPHRRARALLKKLFRSDILWEEVPLPGTKPTLYADFVLPTRKLVVEVHGIQHYEHVEFFHTKQEFKEARMRDVNKKRWCQLNNLIIIELPHKESIDEWTRRIIEFGSSETPEES